MSAQDTQRLIKLVAGSISYGDFERRVIGFLKWYNIPAVWTKADVEKFWNQYRVVENFGGK